MDRKTKTSKNNEFSHPYKEFESTTRWRQLDKAVRELVKNKDIIETTRREYIVGYLCKALSRMKS
jgi:hypothetical protein